jgi:predicted naringenin-chalcone synthase
MRIAPLGHRTRLLGIGTAVPRHRSPQDLIARFMRNVGGAQQGVANGYLRRVDSIAQGSGIETRYSVLPDYIEPDPEKFVFYPRSWSLDPFPTTAARMAIYQRESVPLAQAAAAKALASASIDPTEVTHLVISTCTGFFAPGPDIELGLALGLRPDVQRTVIGFMGCYAGINAIRTADQIVRSDPKAVVLQVSVELCSLHFQREPTVKMLIANTLFGDGAAAAIYGSDGEGRGIATIRGTASHVEANSLDRMRWEIGDYGFIMSLSADIPEHLERGAEKFVQKLLEASGVGDRESIVGWAIHPGGRRILEAVARGLGQPREMAASAFEVLRDFGNMSSATILFVLERELKKIVRPGHVLGLGFGPGLTIEGVTLEVDPA